MKYQLVQVQFVHEERGPAAHPHSSAQRYTYLAPYDWALFVGDEVKHPDMSPFSRAIVCEMDRRAIDTSLDLKVLTDHTEASQSVTVVVPPGYVVQVVPKVIEEARP